MPLDRTLDAIFSRFIGFFVHNNQSLSVYVELQDRERACSTTTARNSFWLCPKVVVNEKPQNLEMTTSSAVLSVVLINR